MIGHTGFQIGRQASHILADRIVIAEEDSADGGHGRAGRPRLPSDPHARDRRSRVPDLHVWIRGDTRLDEAHRLSHVVKDRLMQRYPQIVDAIIHIEPPPGLRRLF